MTLGTFRGWFGAAFLPPLGLESCWGFPVSDACLRELSCVVLRLVLRLVLIFSLVVALAV